MAAIQYLKETETTCKEAVKEFIISSICSVTTLDHVLAQLERLHKEEGLLSADLYKHAQDVAARIYAESAEEDDEPVSKSEQSAVSARTEPLFCKDTVYHAGICSLAVSTCDAGNLLGFFKDKDKVPGHSFREVSISRSKQDRYLVARQGESTFYFAFQSEPRLSEWAKQSSPSTKVHTHRYHMYPLMDYYSSTCMTANLNCFVFRSKGST